MSLTEEYFPLKLSIENIFSSRIICNPSAFSLLSSYESVNRGGNGATGVVEPVTESAGVEAEGTIAKLG